MTQKNVLSLVVAMTPDRVIGRGNTLPWHLPSDLLRFKELTKKMPVIMGRRTHESIIARNGAPLPGRFHIVLTKDHRRFTTGSMAGITAVASFEEASAVVAAKGGRACVIGGAQIYKLFLPHIQRASITTVYASIAGDAHFPELLPYEWECERHLETRRWGLKDQYPTAFHELVRVCS